MITLTEGVDDNGSIGREARPVRDRKSDRQIHRRICLVLLFIERAIR